VVGRLKPFRPYTIRVEKSRCRRGIELHRDAVATGHGTDVDSSRLKRWRAERSPCRRHRAILDISSAAWGASVSERVKVQGCRFNGRQRIAA